MRKLLFVIVFVVSMGTAFAAGAHLYELRPVDGSEDAVACGKAGGMAAQVAHLDAEGSITSAWTNACLVPTDK